MANRVLTEISPDGNATLTLNRPHVHNAFDPEMVGELDECLRELDGNPAVRAVVVQGAGRSFCAGADIEHMKASASFSRQQNLRAAQASARMFQRLRRIGKPTVARVHGAVRGGGVGLVAACDIAIAARDATFRLSEVKLGIIPAMISPYVIAAVGERASRRYMLTGEEFDALEAWRIGLVHEVVNESDLDAAIDLVLAQLRSSGPQAVAAAKELIALNAGGALSDALVNETARRIAAIRATTEAQEGLAAFLEKRKPSWLAAARTSPGSTRPGPTGRKPNAVGAPATRRER
jgi:methylglutaconyl-CoA hydratase